MQVFGRGLRWWWRLALVLAVGATALFLVAIELPYSNVSVALLFLVGPLYLVLFVMVIFAVIWTICRLISRGHAKTRTEER